MTNHFVKYHKVPGMNPDSQSPSRNRVTKNPDLFFMNAWNVATRPQARSWQGSQISAPICRILVSNQIAPVLGLTFWIAMLAGISPMQIPTNTRLLPVLTISWLILMSFIKLSVSALLIFPLENWSACFTESLRTIVPIKI